MADMFRCIQEAIDDRMLDPARGKLAQEEFSQLVENYQRSYDPTTAATMAAKDLKEATTRSARSRRHAVIHQLQTMRRNQAMVDAADDPAELLVHVLNTVEGSKSTAESVRFVQDGLERQFNGMLGKFLSATSRNLLGKQRKPALMKDIVRELFGDASGDGVAKEFAEAITKTRDRARALFNAYGGDIGTLDNYGVMQSHNRNKLVKAKYSVWSKAIHDRLDWARITDHKTGKPFASAGGSPNPGRADEFLQLIYQNITTEGWIKREPSLTTGGKALYNTRADARVLHFKSAEDWLGYNADFGDGDPFSAIMGQIHGMARDIAMLRVLGPSPTAGLEHLIQAATKRAKTAVDAKMEARIRSKAKTARVMLNHLTGSASAPANQAWAGFFAGVRGILTSAQLGSAMLSSASDMATMRAAAQHVGMKPANMITRAASLMASHATRDSAAAMGYVADTLANASSGANRFLGEVWSPEITQRLTDFVMRAQGLSFWTDMNRVAFQMEFSAHLAQNVDRPLADIDAPLRNALSARGITPEDWDLLRAESDALFSAPNGSKFLSPLYWLEHTALPRNQAENLSIRLQSIIQEQMEFAVPSVNLEARAILQGDAPPGTFQGELSRSTLMYKNYALSLTMNQYRRGMSKPTGLSRAAYFGQLIAGLTLMGAVGVQLKELAKGRDPRDMTDPKFWAAAGFQGGGFGIFGDLVYAESSRAGGGLAETLGGPVVGAAGDVIRIGSSNVARISEGKSPMFGRDITNLLRRNTPGTSIWFARTALDRAVWDQMQDLLDPEVDQYRRQAEGRQQRNYGNSSWWNSGDILPSRAPDLSNIAGTQ
ncbi:hypothetical protein [Roseobacter sp. N2S]|uniref:hypothetical protein n=1 Tax=Roseobacter sp. N2S TaxID=2663844 RepID=UPI002866A915|nr:hypothetical protein [Roseobacter sp. N2S]MDR6266535.1 hypothetical protein [Roseobacter sp. N2S]